MELSTTLPVRRDFGVANMADSLYSVKTLVYDEKKITMGELKEALATNYGKGLGAEDVAAMTAKIANELKEAGKTIGEKEVAAIFKYCSCGIRSTGSKGKRGKNPEADRRSAEIRK